MMKYAGIIPSLLLMLVMASCKPSPQKAEQYYDTVIAPLEDVFDKEEALIVLINNKTEQLANSPFTFQSDTVKDLVVVDTSGKHIEQAYNDLISQIALSKIRLSSLKDFDKSSQLKDAALALLNEYDVLCKNEYRALLQILQIPPAEYSSEQEDKFMRLSDTIDYRLKEKITMLTEELKLFSKKYNFKIQEDSVTNAVLP
ncbi:MAG TPA: hypothetical protein PLT47_00965 [Bacteroidales bacterium]|nr:hypothetical protein [Bacteroidales bacterium]HQI69290.1 hypothetical protein [Bacteroidales bacterium]